MVPPAPRAASPKEVGAARGSVVRDLGSPQAATLKVVFGARVRARRVGPLPGPLPGRGAGASLNILRHASNPWLVTRDVGSRVFAD